MVDPLLVGHIIIFALSALACVATVPQARKIKHPGTREGLVAFLGSVAVWSIGYLGYLIVPTRSGKIAFYILGFVFAFVAVGAWLYFCAAYTSRSPRHTPFRNLILWTFLFFTALKVTNPLHNLYFTTEWVTEPFPHLVIHHELLYWVVLGLSYAAIAVGFFVLLERFYHTGSDSRPLVILIGLSGLPAIATIIGGHVDWLLPLMYEPPGVALFAVGTLFFYRQRFETIRLTGGSTKPAIFLDQDTCIRDYNRAARRLFPTLEESFGKSLKTVNTALAEHLTKQDVLTISQDDETRYYDVSSTPFLAGEVTTGQLVTVSDVTERESYRQRLEEKTEELEDLTDRLEEQYRTLFEEAPVMAVVTRAANGRPIIEDCNNQFAETLGIEPDTLVGTELAEFYTPDPREELIDDDGYERSLEGNFTNESRELVTADGDIVETLLRAVPRKDASGEVVGTLAMYIDITEREEVKRANERLEEFTSIVSHDLRNPLSVASGYTELARNDCESPHLETVERAHDRMRVLIEDLLTLAREGEAVTETEAINLTAVVGECWENVDTAGASLTIETDRTIVADDSRLKQLFENLIRNAVEHGGSTVTVTVGGLEDGFYIEDDGPGISGTDAEAVFETGYSTNDEGTGFGLSIVQRIVEAHEWDIRVTNSSEGGARFEITGVEFTAE
ncbi:histidine kinase N-terminal 7TM domain-containing protein [Halobellus ordinarius]|uniref:sensor histidine kinase n=1 Tax=Halobellus ordinarius TaxID=3075120 RepID=UPI0028801388|nr:histidine kinase N-terminal 7TM domain-containing protein [Halobellus sp. ZY16]